MHQLPSTLDQKIVEMCKVVLICKVVIIWGFKDNQTKFTLIKS